MQALAMSDEAVNGGRRLKYLIERLEKNTATAAVREQQASDGGPTESGMDYFASAASAIYHDRPEARALPIKLVRYVEEIAAGAGETFQKGEIKAANDNVIFVDQNLVKNAARVISDIKRLNLGQTRPYAGVANISLDGRVTTLDERGEGDKASITLTAGGKNIDCLVHRIDVDELRKLWKQRCIVTGIGHYSGNSRLPDYIEATHIKPVGEGLNWREWRGGFNPINLDESDWE